MYAVPDYKEKVLFSFKGNADDILKKVELYGRLITDYSCHHHGFRHTEYPQYAKMVATGISPNAPKAPFKAYWHPVRGIDASMTSYQGDPDKFKSIKKMMLSSGHREVIDTNESRQVFIARTWGPHEGNIYVKAPDWEKMRKVNGYALLANIYLAKVDSEYMAIESVSLNLITSPIDAMIMSIATDPNNAVRDTQSFMPLSFIDTYKMTNPGLLNGWPPVVTVSMLADGPECNKWTVNSSTPFMSTEYFKSHSVGWLLGFEYSNTISYAEAHRDPDKKSRTLISKHPYH